MRRGSGAFAVMVACAVVACESSVRPVQFVTAGNGRAGELVVNDPVQLNTCVPATASGQRATLLAGDTLRFQPEGLVPLHQTRSVEDPGAFELERIASVSTDGAAVILTFEAELSRSYVISTDGGHDRAQVCHLPQFTRATVAPHASIVAGGWHGP